MEIPVEIRLSTLGLAAKAGKLVYGTQFVCEGLQAKKVVAVIEAAGTGSNTAKRLRDRCAFYEIPLYLCSADAETLGRALGKGPIAAVGLSDASFARAIIEHPRNDSAEKQNP